MSCLCCACFTLLAVEIKEESLMSVLVAVEIKEESLMSVLFAVEIKDESLMIVLLSCVLLRSKKKC